ncbi:MAG: hypothetical protein IKR34_07970 [Candidatus Gastranaerophilales bacterium]|nr:hypothetical protein [Candidatus Gastranaerophilales bacterium]
MKINSFSKIIPQYNIRTFDTRPKLQNKSENKISAPVLNPSYIVPFMGDNYSYKRISRLEPNFSPLYCDYSNPVEFSNAFAEKIDSQMLSVDEKDIENLVMRIKIKTGADEGLIREFLYRLTEFSSYDTINIFQDIAQKYSTNTFGITMEKGSTENDYSLNSALNYLSSNKQMIDIENPTSRRIIVLDDIFLKQLEESKKGDRKFYDNFMSDLESGNLVILNLEGWDVECADKNYRSANFFCGTGYLEDMTIDCLKRFKNGEDINKILYGNFEERLKNITGKDVKVIKIKNRNIQGKKQYKDILQNIKRPSLTPLEIQTAIRNHIRIISKKSMKEELNNIAHLESFCKYLDSSTVIYSSDSLGEELANLKKQIDKKYGNNHKYMVLANNKSFGYMTAIYAKINNIDPKDIATLGYIGKNRIKDDTTYIALDDITASGDTIYRYIIDSQILKIEQNIDLIFATILASENSINRIKKSMYQPRIIYAKKLKNLLANLNDDELLKQKDKIFISKRVGTGWRQSDLSCIFPHIIPDNTTKLSGRLFRKLLIKNTHKSNKS